MISGYLNNTKVGGGVFPAGRSIDLEVMASNSTYRAPADGYFAIGFNRATGFRFSGSTTLLNNGCTVFSHYDDGDSGFAYIPIKKGHAVRMLYNSLTIVPDSWNYFRFVYAD